MRERAPHHPEPDGFHPSAEGYEEWAKRMLPAVAPLLGERAA